jgi:uncharacterized protein YcnI
MRLIFARAVARTVFPICALGPWWLAQAHVVLEYPAVPAASHYKATFKVGHGCGASPTRQMVVDIPAGVRSVRPMPKPGWTLQIQHQPALEVASPAAQNTTPERAANSDVQRVTWTANSAQDWLPSTHYDEFVLVARLPPQAGPLYWPVRQVCEEGQIDWVEVPSGPQPFSSLKNPAALLEIWPSGGAVGHNH